MKNDKTTKHQFSADRPITSHTEDLLGRADFAESLALAIKGWNENDSLVIALYGPWGSGKSSLKNIVIEALRSSKEDCPHIVEFNPWQWAGQEQLVGAFFKEIGTVLGRADKTKGKKRAARWRQYSNYLTVGASLIKSSKFLLPLLGIPETGIPDVFAIGLEESSKVSKETAEMLSAHPEDNLIEIKNDLSKMLGTLRKPLLIVMDDIDRLSSGEIKLLFQIVKANADFPNMIYLLLFQRDIVERSLEDISPITGREFLEKIVQVGFDIPKVERSRMEKVLFNGLDELLSDKTIEQRFDQNRWGNIFVPGLRHYFETLRDVNRFLATLSFHFSLFRKTGSFEVNPIDLIALEVLRVFEPAVYNQLYGAKYILTGQMVRELSSDKDREKTRKTIEDIVEQGFEPNRPQVQEILKQLFPPIEWVFGGYGYGSEFREQWFCDLRVCHSDVFDRYFHLTIPEGDIPQADLDRILSLVGNREALVNEFSNLNRRGLLGITLDRLEAYKEKIELQHAVPFVTAIMDIGDELPNDQGGWFSIDSDMHATRIIYWYLKQEKDLGKRGQILKESIKNTLGLYLPIMYTSIEGDRQNKQKDIDDLTVTEKDLKELQEICVEKIRQAAESGTLMAHPKMAKILYEWRKWASPEEPKKWVTRLMESPKGVLSFLVAFLSQSKSQGQGDYVYQTHWRISLKSVEAFVPIDIIEEKIKGLTIEELSDKEQQAVRVFQKALKRRAEGKPEDSWHVDEDE